MAKDASPSRTSWSKGWSRSGVPVLYKLPLGHGKHLATLPLGVPATLDADARTLTIDEPALLGAANPSGRRGRKRGRHEKDALADRRHRSPRSTLALTACGGSSGTNATGSGGSETGARRQRAASCGSGRSTTSTRSTRSTTSSPRLTRPSSCSTRSSSSTTSRTASYVIDGDWADSWDTSADGKDWTFHLKSGRKWSDGTAAHGRGRRLDDRTRRPSTRAARRRSWRPRSRT